METNDQARPQRSGENVNFERIRRITGYLVGTTDRWNDAKGEAHSEKLKHGTHRRPPGRKIPGGRSVVMTLKRKCFE